MNWLVLFIVVFQKGTMKSGSELLLVGFASFAKLWQYKSLWLSHQEVPDGPSVPRGSSSLRPLPRSLFPTSLSTEHRFLVTIDVINRQISLLLFPLPWSDLPVPSFMPFLSFLFCKFFYPYPNKGLMKVPLRFVRVLR